jgi:hypothetical protein
MDFTLAQYKQLLLVLKSRDYAFKTFAQMIENPNSHAIILRHDVDTNPQNSLSFAKLQAENGIKGSYYFRTVAESYDESIIKQIAELGHEIGYHYETMDTKSGDIDKAYDEFCINLEMFRNLYPVTTICMHGSPRSKFDNKDIWKKYDYKSLGIIGEPYFDVNFNEVFYLTDTGRRWDGWEYSIRDKLPMQKEWIDRGMVYHSTQDIIKAINNNDFPKKVMFTFHPQRWHSKLFPWTKEFGLQNSKNVIKYFMIKYIQ